MRNGRQQCAVAVLQRDQRAECGIRARQGRAGPHQPGEVGAQTAAPVQEADHHRRRVSFLLVLWYLYKVKNMFFWYEMMFCNCKSYKMANI